ncbi:unnamed protein product, partial [marine sediment metagenome]
AQATGSGGELHKIEADRPSTMGFVGPLPILRQAGGDVDDARSAQLTTTPPTATVHDIRSDGTSKPKAAPSQALAAAKNEYHRRADTHSLVPARVSRAATEKPSSAEMLIEPDFAEETPTAQRSSIEEVTPKEAGQWRRWVVGWLAIRDAVGNLPPIPTSVWALGVLVFASANMASVIRFRRRVRSAVSAPENIVRMVSATAAKMGLRHVPEVLTVTEQMSPVVWCGRRPRLLL